MKQIGGLYKREGKNSGKKYLYGYITIVNSLGEEEKVAFSVFPNHFKEEERHFDYCVYLDDKYKPKPKPQTQKSKSEQPDEENPFDTEEVSSEEEPF